MKIRLSKSSVGENEISAVIEVLKRGYLGMGEEVKLFEQELKKYFGNKMHVVCVSSGTAALQLALEAHGVGPGDEVIVPSLTYVATFQAITATGALPVAVDVDYNTGFMKVEDAKERLTRNTKVIMPVHYASNCKNISAIYELADEYGVAVIEDAAHSFGGLNNNQKIGSSGQTLCFSFDGIKNITCGEGGAIVYSDNVLAKISEDIRLLGVEKDTELRFDGKRSWDFDVSKQGWRYHMSNIMAAIGRVQLKRIDEFSKKRRRLANLYHSELKNHKNIILFEHDLEQSCPHIFPVKIQSGLRSKVQEALLKSDIEFGYHYKPNHLLSYFRDMEYQFPISERLWQELITLPLHFDLSESDIKKICSVLKSSINAA